MRIFCQQTILVKYHAVFAIFKKSSKILNCCLLQNIGGALRVNLRLMFKTFKCFSLTILYKMLVIRALFMNNFFICTQTVLNLHCVCLKLYFQALRTLLCLELSCVYSVFTISINVQFNPKPLLFLSTS